MTVESNKRTDRDYEHSRERRQLRTELPQDFLLITKDESSADESRRQCLPFSEATCCLPCSVDPRKRALSGLKDYTLTWSRFHGLASF